MKRGLGRGLDSLFGNFEEEKEGEVKTEVKVAVSGMYITEIKYVRGKVDMPKKKKSWFKRLQQKAIDNARGTDTSETKKKKK